jgi:hypothetical protein
MQFEKKISSKKILSGVLWNWGDPGSVKGVKEVRIVLLP